MDLYFLNSDKAKQLPIYSTVAKFIINTEKSLLCCNFALISIFHSCVTPTISGFQSFTSIRIKNT